MKKSIENPKYIKLINHCSHLCHWHRKHRVRQKNYHRLQRYFDIKRIKKKLFTQECAKYVSTGRNK